MREKWIRGLALDAGLVVTESNETESERHVSSSRSGKDTHAEDADINSVNDKQPLAEVTLNVQHDTLANEQQYFGASEPIYDTHLLEKDNEKLHKENKHLEQTYKDLYDSIKTTRVQTKDHNDSLIAQINSKTVEMLIYRLWNSSKNMPRFSSNDMVHNYYLEESRKKTQRKR
ncbi:hypothetical protein Tco_0098493 [Tanacetum coccineum]